MLLPGENRENSPPSDPEDGRIIENVPDNRESHLEKTKKDYTEKKVVLII